jgi:hypothetical protein
MATELKEKEDVKKAGWMQLSRAARVSFGCLLHFIRWQNI